MQDEELIERTISVELREAANLLELSGDLDLRDACRDAADRLEALAQPVVGVVTCPICSDAGEGHCPICAGCGHLTTEEATAWMRHYVANAPR